MFYFSKNEWHSEYTVNFYYINKINGNIQTLSTVNCPELSDPTDGAVTLTNRTEGSIAQYTCNSGFVVSGESSRECGADGRWSGEELTCCEL